MGKIIGWMPETKKKPVTKTAREAEKDAVETKTPSGNSCNPGQ